MPVYTHWTPKKDRLSLCLIMLCPVLFVGVVALYLYIQCEAPQ